MRRLWRWIKEINKNAHHCLENVVFRDLSEQWEMVCKDYGEPLVINSKDHSYTHRKRAWWISWQTPKDMLDHLQPLNPNDCLDKGRRLDLENGMTTVTTSWKGEMQLIHDTSVPIIALDESVEGRQSIRSHEAERLHHLPSGYTAVPEMSEAERLRAIGDGWDTAFLRS